MITKTTRTTSKELERIRTMWNKANNLTEKNMTSSQLDHLRAEIKCIIDQMPEKTYVHPKKSIPNVGELKVEVSPELNHLLKTKSRNKTIIPILHVYKYYNKPMNRFSYHKFLRLNRYRSDQAKL